MIGTKAGKRTEGRSIVAIAVSAFFLSMLAAPLASAQVPDIEIPEVPDIEIPDTFVPDENISGSWVGDLSGETEISGNADIEGAVQAGAVVWVTSPNATVNVAGGMSGGSVNVSTPGVTLSISGGVSGGSLSLATESVTLEVTGDVSGGTVVVNGNVLVSGSVRGSADIEVRENAAEVKVKGSVEGGNIRATAPNVTIDIENDFVSGGISVNRAAEIRAGRVAAGKTVAVDVESSPLTGVNISVKNDVVNLSIRMDNLGEKPLEIAVAPPGEAYSYLEIDAENVTEDDISTATVEVKVEKTWLESKGIGADAVEMYRYHQGEWQQLTVTQTGEDSSYVYYSASTPGFSTFVISGGAAAVSLVLVIVAAIFSALLSITAVKFIVLRRYG